MNGFLCEKVEGYEVPLELENLNIKVKGQFYTDSL